MPFYHKQHEFYCGIDLHASKMYLCILDAQGEKLLHKNIKTRADHFLAVIRPFREGNLVVGVESTFNWYWLADLCLESQISFVLGHALALKAIHGGKTKNDKIDSEKLARLLRGGNFPQAYVYPREYRATRDLCRRRTYLVRRRGELMTHIRNTATQHNLELVTGQLAYPGNRKDLDRRFEHPSTQLSIQVDCEMIGALTEQIRKIERYLTDEAKLQLPQPYYNLLSVPGVGKVLALVLLYEIGSVDRFANVGRFLSYGRLVPGRHESAGKHYGSPGRKQGNAHLKWAFSEVATLMMRECAPVKQYVDRLEKKVGKNKALSILAARTGRAVYFMLKRGEAFDIKRLLNQ
jgi:transposase